MQQEEESVRGIHSSTHPLRKRWGSGETGFQWGITQKNENP